MPADYTGASGNEEKKADAEEPDAHHSGQSGRNQTLAEEPLGTSCQQIEERRIEIRTVCDCRPGILEAGQTTKVDGKELVEPEALSAGFQKEICEVNGRDDTDSGKYFPV